MQLPKRGIRARQTQVRLCSETRNLFSALFLNQNMGKLNIAHHKSYHPYRRDNIERVRRDEEEAAIKEAREEGRMALAVRRNLWVRG